MVKGQIKSQVEVVARDYIILADGTRLEKGDPIPEGVSVPPSFKEKK